MADLNIYAKDQNGNPVADTLITLNTFDALDYTKFGIPINPNPRRTSGDGGVNFYHGGPLARPIMVQASCQNGTSEPMRFDGTADLFINLVVVPFA